jgi:hypothetical protein
MYAYGSGHKYFVMIETEPFKKYYIVVEKIKYVGN